LGSIPSQQYIVSAVLKLYCIIAAPYPPPVEVDVHATSDSWSESTITWNNAPAVGALVGNDTVGGTGQYWSWNITEFIRTQYAGDKLASVILKFKVDDPNQTNPYLHRDFRSREYAGTAMDPYLEIVYVQQYYLTVGTNPPGITTIPGQGWYPNCTYVSLTAPSYVPNASGVNGERYRFDHWTVDGTPQIGNPISVHMGANHTAIAYYVKQFRVVFSQSGVGSDFTGTVVTVDATPYTVSTLPATFWWDENSIHNFAFASPLVVDADKQYMWISTTGLSSLQNDSITVSMAGDVTGNYKTQYYLTVSSPYDTPAPTSDWFDSGTSINASVTSPWAGPPGTRYVCIGWTGTGSVPPSGSETSVVFTITAPSSIAWNWKTQYLLTVLTDPLGLSPQPSRNPPGEAGSPDSWWYDAGTGVTLTAQPVLGYVFNYWDVDGYSQGTGTNPIIVDMNAPYTVTAHYQVPVGGYSISLTKQVPAVHLFGYVSLMTILGAAIAIFRRKKK
jgi:hypothetical protein